MGGLYMALEGLCTPGENEEKVHYTSEEEIVEEKLGKQPKWMIKGDLTTVLVPDTPPPFWRVEK